MALRGGCSGYFIADPWMSSPLGSAPHITMHLMLRGAVQTFTHRSRVGRDAGQRGALDGTANSLTVRLFTPTPRGASIVHELSASIEPGLLLIALIDYCLPQQIYRSTWAVRHLLSHPAPRARRRDRKSRAPGADT